MPREIADASLRGFFAVELERTLLEEAKRIEDTLRARIASGVAVRWTHDEGPHVTLGRVKQGRLRAGEVEGGSAAGGAAQRVHEIVLFHSERHRSGAYYTPLERIALGGTVEPS